MNRETHHELLMVLIIIILVAGLFLVADQRDSLKQQAVDKGFAEWYITPGSKEVEFKWKEPIK